MSFVNKDIRGTFEISLATYQLKSETKYAKCVFYVLVVNKIRKMCILFHTLMKNVICLMVSDAKLCNNVANYGTNVFIR